mgnify:CR=1 FL=1
MHLAQKESFKFVINIENRKGWKKSIAICMQMIYIYCNELRKYCTKDGAIAQKLHRRADALPAGSRRHNKKRREEI